MALNPSWEPKRHLASQETPAFCGTQRFITLFTKDRHMHLP
jgi:hypothetical protein